MLHGENKIAIMVDWGHQLKAYRHKGVQHWEQKRVNITQAISGWLVTILIILKSHTPYPRSPRVREETHVQLHHYALLATWNLQSPGDSLGTRKAVSS